MVGKQIEQEPVHKTNLEKEGRELEEFARNLGAEIYGVASAGAFERFPTMKTKITFVSLFCLEIRRVVEKRRYCELKICPFFSETLKGVISELVGVNLT